MLFKYDWCAGGKSSDPAAAGRLGGRLQASVKSSAASSSWKALILLPRCCSQNPEASGAVLLAWAFLSASSRLPTGWVQNTQLAGLHHMALQFSSQLPLRHLASLPRMGLRATGHHLPRRCGCGVLCAAGVGQLAARLHFWRWGQRRRGRGQGLPQGRPLGRNAACLR